MNDRLLRSDRRCVGQTAGFSLTELLVALTIFAVVAAILSTILISTNHVHRQTADRADIQGGARQALSLMNTEISQAGADPKVPPAGIVGVVAADSASVRVRADLNADGVIETAEPSEDVTYSYSANTQSLLRDPGTGAVTMLQNVTAMSFSYFDASDQPLASLPLSASDRSLVRSIVINLSCQDQDSHPFTDSIKITLRNQAD